MTELNRFQWEIEFLLKKADKSTDRRLYDLYIDTIKDLKKSLLVDYQRIGELKSSERLKLSQMTALLEQLERSSSELKKELKNEITGHLIHTGQIAYNELFYEYETSHAGINFALLKEDELRTIIETPIANFKLSERLDDGVVERLKSNIKDDLNRVFLNGDSYAKAAARLAEQGYSSYRRAIMITRTEAGRVQAVAREKAQVEARNLGIDFDKVWVATLDGRTRHNHAELDGAKADKDGYFEINGLRTKQPHMFGFASEDVNCRCRTISRLKDDKTPLLRRDNETGEVVEYRNYRDWEKATLEHRLATNERKSIDNRLYRKYHIDNSQTKDISTETLKTVNESLDKLMQKHKGIKPYLKKVTFTDSLADTTASAGIRFNKGKAEFSIKLNHEHFKKPETIQKLIDIRVADGEWTPKNGINGILEHEVIHLREYKAIVKRYGTLNGTNTEAQKSKIRKAFANNELPKEIKETALKNLQIPDENAIIESRLGRYATENAAEFVAEAYSDASNSEIAIEVRRLVDKKWR